MSSDFCWLFLKVRVWVHEPQNPRFVGHVFVELCAKSVLNLHMENCMGNCMGKAQKKNWNVKMLKKNKSSCLLFLVGYFWRWGSGYTNPRIPDSWVMFLWSCEQKVCKKCAKFAHGKLHGKLHGKSTEKKLKCENVEKK